MKVQKAVTYKHKVKNQQFFMNQQKPIEEIVVDNRSQFIMQ